MKELKDWSKDITELGDMEVSALENVYSDMLATAHDLKFAVPDDLLVETQDPAKLREVIPPLHEAIKSYHAEQKNKPVAEKTKTPRAPKPAKAAAPKAKETKAPKKPAKAAAQKEPVVQESDTMTTTAKKTAKTAKTAKKASKAAPAAKKGAKSAAGNARTPVGRSKFTDDQVITVKFKEVPGREDSGAYERLKNLSKFNGKTVGAFLKSDLGRSSTLANCARKGLITIK